MELAPFLRTATLRWALATLRWALALTKEEFVGTGPPTKCGVSLRPMPSVGNWPTGTIISAQRFISASSTSALPEPASTDEIVACDSNRTSGHEQLIQTSIKPFLDYVAGADLTMTVIDERKGIERQPHEPSEEANACGFAAPLFLSTALSAGDGRGLGGLELLLARLLAELLGEVGLQRHG